MTLSEKRKRAGAIAVSYYFQTEMNSSELLQDNWSKMGISRTMNDTEMMLRRGKSPGIKNL
ncbi:hypothetical protein [Lutibacter sp.]|uniref:hypothetical protein n=1 Tax=Lutibacter sp. TaxID=1925666 RepID=UPI00273411BB|nr:hypothetical protein [Lutibacter sp.]MDP3312809.1 hypothetical protein [Lutibacter sp.]